MATKITGYRMFTSSGGNSCVQCGVRMRKGLPYLSPIKGKRVVHEMKGKSLCISCLLELHGNATQMLTAKGMQEELEKYDTSRFLEHLDKE